MLSGTRCSLLLSALLASSYAASAQVSITYNVVPMGGNVYRYVYSITNHGASSSVQLFDILFNTSLYQQSSLQIMTPPVLQAQWQEQILSAIPPAIPAAYDAYALAGGIAPGATVSGFSVQFTWLGSGVPGAQPFEIYDASNFTLLQTGTTAVSPNATIPAASTLSLALLGMTLAIAAAFQSRLRMAEEASRSRSPESW